jgi:hypothetical protein
VSGSTGDNFGDRSRAGMLHSHSGQRRCVVRALNGRRRQRARPRSGRIAWRRTMRLFTRMGGSSANSKCSVWSSQRVEHNLGFEQRQRRAHTMVNPSAEGHMVTGRGTVEHDVVGPIELRRIAVRGTPEQQHRRARDLSAGELGRRVLPGMQTLLRAADNEPRRRRLPTSTREKTRQKKTEPAKPRRSGASELVRWWRGRDLNSRPSGSERLDNRPPNAVEDARVRPSWRVIPPSVVASIACA